MQKILVFIFIFSSFITSQINKNNKNFYNNITSAQSLVQYTIYFLPSAKNKAYFLYKIPFNKIIFEKSKNTFVANIRVTLEVLNDNNEIFRELEERKITTNSYKNTRVNNKFVNGVIILDSLKKNYKIIPIIEDLKSNRQIRGRTIFLRNKLNNNKFLEPIILSRKIITFKNNVGYSVENFGGNLPFGENQNMFLFPTIDLKTENIFIRIKKENKIIVSKKLSNPVKGKFKIERSNNYIVLNNKIGKDVQYFRYNDLGRKLTEGKVTIELSTTPTFDNAFKLVKKVVWYNKPFSLSNIENAIKYLKYIEPDSIISNLLDYDSEDYPKYLFNYWKKYDPDTTSSFNPVMFEYYKRIDYAIKNFTPISRKNGAKTDRGKIYIKYGKPNKNERTSNIYGQVTEIWWYKKPDRKFVFIDKLGIGDFTLVSN